MSSSRAQLARDGERIVVRVNGREISATPAHRVDQVVLVGRIQPTCAALDLLLARHIPLHYLSSRGLLKGSFEPPVGKNMLLRRAQYHRADDPAFRLSVSRGIVVAKLHNQRAACRRWGRNHALAVADEAATAVDRCLARVEGAGTDELLGQEGHATRAYYGAMRALLEDKLSFPKRTRRPATDPVSALLNLAAGLLRSQVFTVLQLVSLDPFVGFYHAPKYGRPALALDLMEEFRPLLADAVAVAAINRQVIGVDDFERDEQALVLTEPALERFVALFDRRLRDETTHPVTGRALDYRQCLELQGRVLVKAVSGELPGYVGFAPER